MNLLLKYSVYLTLILTCTVIEISCKGKLIKIEENNWKEILQDEWMVEFFAPWCPACNALQPIWTEFADWSDELEIKVGHVDVTENPGLSGRFMVTALPTIYHVKNGEFRMYRGAREKNEFISFIEDAKWESVEQISGWKSPDSILMSIVAYFFKLSMLMRSIHTTLIEEYSIPYWASYLVFALATILIGAILGLLLVCVIDCVYPPRSIDSGMPFPSDKVSFEQQNLDDDIIQDDKEEVASVHSSDDERRKGKTSDAEDTQSDQDSQAEEEEIKESGDQGSPRTKDVRKRTAARRDD